MEKVEKMIPTEDMTVNKYGELYSEVFEYGPLGSIETKTITNEKKNEITLICEIKIKMNTKDGGINKTAHSKHMNAIKKSKGITPIWHYLNEHKKSHTYIEKHPEI